MRTSTTIRVDTSTRDAVRQLADDDQITLDEMIRRLAREERQRRIGSALNAPLDADDNAWLDVGLVTVRDDARR